MKLNGGLQLKACNDVKIGYTKQSVSIVGRIAVTCTHANLVKVICDEKCACKQVTIDVINDFLKGLNVPDVSSTKVLPTVDVHLKLRT